MTYLWISVLLGVLLCVSLLAIIILSLIHISEPTRH